MSITRTGLFSSIQSARHSGNSVACPRSIPSTKRFIQPSAEAESYRGVNHSYRVFTHGVIPGCEPYLDSGNQLSRKSTRSTSWDLATMESRNGALCRTGCIAEADGDLCGGSNGISDARGRGRFRPRDDCCVRDIKCTKCSSDWA